jgi:hypothetical protein
MKQPRSKAAEYHEAIGQFSPKCHPRMFLSEVQSEIARGEPSRTTAKSSGKATNRQRQNCGELTPKRSNSRSRDAAQLALH